MSFLVKVPAHTTKHIMWATDGKSAVAYMLVGYCQTTLAYYRALFVEARRSFPQLSAEEFECRQVRNSATVHGHTLALWKVAGPPRDIPGWSQEFGDGLNFGY